MIETVYKLVKSINNSEEVICRSYASMPTKMEMERLHDEFQKLIEAGCLKASIFVPESQTGFRLTYTDKSKKVVDIWYDIRIETNYSIR